MNTLYIALAMLAGLSAGHSAPVQAASDSPVVKRVSLQNVSLPYVEQGDGIPVIFVHGEISDLRAWEPQRRAVVPGYRFIAYTQRYFSGARAPGRGAPYSVETHVADLRAFIAHLDAGPVYLVGHSYGGAVAIRAALQDPDLVRGVFVNEPLIDLAVAGADVRNILGRERRGLGGAQKAAVAGNAEAAVRLLSDWSNQRTGGFHELPPERRTMHMDNRRSVLQHLSAPRSRPLGCAELRKFEPPLTITVGERTRPFFRALTDELHQCVSGSELIQISGAGHLGPSQYPTLFNRELVSFLRKYESEEKSPGEHLRSGGRSSAATSAITCDGRAI